MISLIKDFSWKRLALFLLACFGSAFVLACVMISVQAYGSKALIWWAVAAVPAVGAFWVGKRILVIKRTEKAASQATYNQEEIYNSLTKNGRKFFNEGADNQGHEIKISLKEDPATGEKKLDVVMPDMEDIPQQPSAPAVQDPKPAAKATKGKKIQEKAAAKPRVIVPKKPKKATKGKKR